MTKQNYAAINKWKSEKADRIQILPRKEEHIPERIQMAIDAGHAKSRQAYILNGTVYRESKMKKRLRGISPEPCRSFLLFLLFLVEFPQLLLSVPTPPFRTGDLLLGLDPLQAFSLIERFIDDLQLQNVR